LAFLGRPQRALRVAHDAASAWVALAPIALALGRVHCDGPASIGKIATMDIEEHGMQTKSQTAHKTAAQRIAGFVARQKHNYRVGVARAAANSFLMSLTSQYNAIYTVGLGADAVQLGSLSSIGSAISTLVSIPVGWLVDRRGIRLFFMLSIALSAGGALLYGVAPIWQILIAATILTSIATRLSGTSSSVICADSVQNKDRVTAQNVCGTLSAVVSMVSPLLAAYLVTAFGGMNVQGIRPLYYVRFAGYGLVFLVVAVALREPRRREHDEEKGNLSFVGDFGQLLKGRPLLWRWIVISALTSVPMAVF
jgi:MFS family permease